jgi:arginyl-tRNA synthetase
LRETLDAAAAAGELPALTLEPAVTVPKDKAHGDYATNLALVAAKAAGRKPQEIAALLVARLRKNGMFRKIDIAGPGFINFYVDAGYWPGELARLAKLGDALTQGKPEKPLKMMVEFVSANPTGPLHVGHGRGAAVGDSLVRLLRAVGHAVDAEYYVNDAGNQMATLGRSTWVRYQQQHGRTVDMPENHYMGDYMNDVAAALTKERGASLLALPEGEALAVCEAFAGKAILDGIREDLAHFGVTFQRWYSEKALVDSGRVDGEIAALQKAGWIVERDGALWLRTIDLVGDDKDRVVVRQNGIKTYYASDIAYHLEKFERGYDVCVNIWGSDHHGYMPRIRAVLQAAGIAQERLQILLVQFVNLLRDGKQISMSTRSGEFETLKSVVDEVGQDAARFFFMLRKSDAHLDFDLELAKKQSNDNPVFYVQYAHARICSVFKNAAEKGVPELGADGVNFSLLASEEEIALIKSIQDYPRVLASAAADFAPHRVSFYLLELAARFHKFYNTQRIVDEENVPLSQARMVLCRTVQRVVRAALSIYAVSAPETM